MKVRGTFYLLIFSALAMFAFAPNDVTAQSSSTERVILRLNVDTVPEPLLSDTSATAQRSTIQNAQTLASFVIAPLPNARVRTRFETLPYLVVEVDAATRSRLENSPLVRSIEDDIPIPLSIDRTAPAQTSSANLFVGAQEAWSYGFDGSGQTVGIIDTGVDNMHPALAGKVIFEGCFTDGDCVEGLDAVLGPDVALPFECDDCDHGTHVAGIVAGKDGDFSGVAPGASIAAMNAFSLFGEAGSNDASMCETFNLDAPCTLSYTSHQVFALEVLYLYRNDYNIAAVNMSLGGSGAYSSTCDNSLTSVFLDAVEALRLVDIPVIAASGNGSSSTGIALPACASNIISVGAVNNIDVVLRFSNSAAILDLLAPGNAITSSLPGGGYGMKWGTSMATPYVSGTWAIMRQTYPNLDLDDILLRLKRTGRIVTDSRNNLEFPRIQVNALIREALGYPYIPPGLTNAFVTRRDFETVLLQQAQGGVSPTGARFIGRQIEILVEASDVEVAVMIRPWSEEGTISFAVISQERTDGSTLNQTTRNLIGDVLPEILVATFDTILSSDCFAANFDADVIYIDDLGLLRIYGTPDVSCPPYQPNG